MKTTLKEADLKKLRKREEALRKKVVASMNEFVKVGDKYLEAVLKVAAMHKGGHKKVKARLHRAARHLDRIHKIIKKV